MQRPAALGFLNATPLLEKEGYTFLSAKFQDMFDPLQLHRPRAMPALATDDYPVDA
jgi:hypothetical protein